MNSDIRTPIGTMFSLIGLILLVYGLASDPAIYQKSLGINMNLYWGLAMMIFGIPMLIFGLRSGKKAKK